MPLMDLLDQMKTFVRIVDTGRLSAAAKDQGLSVAAVSRQLAALERDLGTSLVVRSTRQIAITDTGRRWYQHCSRILSEVEAARADVGDSDEVRGSVVLSAPISYGLAHLVSRIEQLARVHPQLSVELRLQDHAIDLLGDGVDIAVRVGMALPDSTSFVAHRLVTFRRAALASAAYLRRRGTPKHPDDLARHELLSHSRASASFTRWRFERDGETVEITPRARLASTSPLVLRDWALSGAGIALIPEWLAGDLRRVLTGWTTAPITAYALHRSEARDMARIRVVVAALAEGMTDGAEVR